MARDFSARTDIDNNDLVNFPDGRILDSSSPAANDGTAVVEAVLGDLHQFFLKLLRDASISPSGNADTNSTSQYLDGLVAKIRATTTSTTQAGSIELATNAEVNTGTDTTRAITPSGLAQRAASTILTGLIELATNTEVQTGTDTTRAVTPAGLASLTSTATRRGIIELATQTEVDDGTDALRSITPDTLRDTPSVVGRATSSKLNIDTIDITAWNMDLTPNLFIVHGLTFGNIVSVSGVIRNDTGDTYYPLGARYVGSTPIDAGIESYTSSSIRLSRTTGGFFDSTEFDDIGFNRGFLTVAYTV